MPRILRLALLCCLLTGCGEHRFHAHDYVRVRATDRVGHVLERVESCPRCNESRYLIRLEGGAEVVLHEQALQFEPGYGPVP